MRRYIFKPYSQIFPQLFTQEKSRLASQIQAALTIEHVGSTAVPNLGGKGIIDIALSVSKDDMVAVQPQLQALGYELRQAGSTSDRLLYQTNLPDPEEGNKCYQIHLN